MYKNINDWVNSLSNCNSYKQLNEEQKIHWGKILQRTITRVFLYHKPLEEQIENLNHIYREYLIFIGVI